MSNSPNLFEGVIDVDVSRTIEASPQRVFRAWTDPDIFRRWFEAEAVQMDPRVGGLFYVEVDHEGRRWAHFGRYLEVDAPRRLEFTWMSEATHGIETIVTVELSLTDDGGTRMRLTHTGLPDSELSRGHEEGWRELLATIDPFVADAPASDPPTRDEDG